MPPAVSPATSRSMARAWRFSGLGMALLTPFWPDRLCPSTLPASLPASAAPRPASARAPSLSLVTSAGPPRLASLPAMGLAENIRFSASTDVGRLRDHNEDNFLVDKKLCALHRRRRHGRPRRGRGRERARRAHHPRGAEEGARDHRGARARQSRGRRRATSSACSSRRCSAPAPRSTRRRSADAGQARHGHDALARSSSPASTASSPTSATAASTCSATARIQQVTEDHTVFNELIKRGKLTREQIEKVAQKNAITRAVGVYERVEVDTLIIEVLPGDQFLLASRRPARLHRPHRRARALLRRGRRQRRRSGLIDLANRTRRQGQHHRRPRAARRGRRRRTACARGASR